MIRKSFAVLPGTTKVLDAEQGIVEAFVNTTGVVDLQKDVMEAGTWQEVIKAADAEEIDRPATVWGHDWSETTGKVLTAQELPAGHPEIPEKLAKAHPEAGSLKIRVAYNLDTQRGREAFSDVKFGAIKQWSVGFIPAEGGVRYDSKGIRHISKVAEWPEVSNVLVGASPGTFTATVKVAELEGSEDRPARTADRLARGKAIRGEITKDQRIPDLQGDDAAHMGPLKDALDAVERLIAQEVAEDEPEFDCVVRLACIGMDLLSWAAGEAMDSGGYADGPMPMAAYLAAGIEALKKEETEPTPQLDLTNPFLAGLQAGIDQALAEARSETASTPPQPSVPAHSGESDGLTHWARSRARRRFGG